MKHWIYSTTLVVAVFALAACGGATSSPTEPAQRPALDGGYVVGGNSTTSDTTTTTTDDDDGGYVVGGN